jgi:hypothetical protein
LLRGKKDKEETSFKAFFFAFFAFAVFLFTRKPDSRQWLYDLIDGRVGGKENHSKMERTAAS